MAEPMLTLQINATGAWRNVTRFPAERHAEVVAAVAPLQRALGMAVTWALLHPCDSHPQGRRELLQLPAPEPAP